MIYFLFLAITVSTVTGFMPVTPVTTRQGLSTRSLRMGLKESMSSMFDKLNAAYDLKLTDYTEVIGADRLDDGKVSAQCEWWDERVGGKFTGVTKAHVVQGDEELAKLDVWVGPSSHVPHMLLSLMKAADGTFGIEADFVARGQFAIGSDSTYLEDYYENAATLAWYADAVSKSQNNHLAPSASSSGRLLHGSPIYLKVGGMSEGDALSIGEQHLDRWMQYIADAKPSEARQRGGLNVRDDKLRQFSYRAMLVDAKAICDSEDSARALAAGLTGPLAEAYVGGGS